MVKQDDLKYFRFEGKGWPEQLFDLAVDPERARITVRHVLTMQMGTDWNEDLPYTDPRNSEIAMEMADQLMGVTMHDPGCSRLVTVDVEEAAALAAV